MGRVLLISRVDTDGRTSDEHTLLDSATFVHVFRRKEKFTRFKRAVRGQGLFCSNDVIPIEGKGEIALPLKSSAIYTLLMV